MSRLALIVLCIICCASNYSDASRNRILGGEFATELQFPYQVSIRLVDSHACGGTIISKMYIVTAAHCVVSSDDKGVLIPYDLSDLSVCAGSIDRLQGGVVIRVAKVIVHEKYEYPLTDIALLRLKEPIKFSNSIQPIALASSEIPMGSKVIISGWGITQQGSYYSQKLKWIEVTTISRKECKQKINQGSDSLICLAHKPGNGVCVGDSGGPATYKNTLVGVAGFFIFGCGTEFPDGYAKISYHLEWIKKHSDV